MKRAAIVGLFACVALSLAGSARGTWYYFRFTEEDLWNHTVSGDSRLYDQDAPRRHHDVWKADVQTTDSTQPNQSQYQGALGLGTNGWYQTATYDSWLSGGPLDNSNNAFGICQVQLWGANFPNSKFAWGERFKLADTGMSAWQIISTPTGWTGSIILNPWPDPAFSNPMYFVNWDANGYAQRILYSSVGNGVEEYVFEFLVDIVGEYPSNPPESPLDGNPFEADGSLRIWFGGYVLDSSGQWTSEGFDGVMELKPIPAPPALLLGAAGLGLLAVARRRLRR